MTDLLALELKLEKEGKTFLLLSSLSSSYDHLATIIIYVKKTLELKKNQASAPKWRADEEDRFNRGGLIIGYQMVEGEITE